MRVQPDFAIAAPQCLGLRKCQQPAAQTYALAVGGDGDIVEEQIVYRGQQHDNGGYHCPFLKHPYHALRDARRVVLEHRSGRLTHAGDVVPIGVVDDLRDHRDIGSNCGSDARLVHNQTPKCASLPSRKDLPLMNPSNLAQFCFWSFCQAGSTHSGMFARTVRTGAKLGGCGASSGPLPSPSLENGTMISSPTVSTH